MSLKKVISLLFIALVLTNLVHNAIPHHHHLGNTHAHECCDHHDLDIEKMGSWDDCTHCEAFNGMEYYPISQQNKLQSPDQAGSDYIDLQVSLPDLDVVCSGDIFAFTDPPDPYRGPDQKSISLRGPPCGC